MSSDTSAQPDVYLPLTLDQRIARLRFEALIADFPRVDRLYDALPDTRGGRIISTDLARFLDERYRLHVPGLLRDIMPSWEGAWRYAQGRLRREIAHRGQRTTLRLMAGGFAAGKTYALEQTTLADLAWDGTLRDHVWAGEMIELAFDHGWRVEIAFVQRPFELACRGALERGMSEGRVVPLAQLALVQREVQFSVRELYARFRDHPQIHFLLLYNPATSSKPQDVVGLAVADIAPGGKLHYDESDVEAFKETAAKIWEEVRQSRRCSEEVLVAAGKGLVR